jgi:hypothetical protein
MSESTSETKAPQAGEPRDSQVSARLTALEARMRDLEKGAGRQRGIWVERFMYWAVVIALVIAIIQVA